MIPPLPAWLRHPDVDADRLLVAAWLWLNEEIEAATGTAASVGVDTGAVDELAGLIDDHQQVGNDPSSYAFGAYGATTSFGLGWNEWARQEQNQIEDTIATMARDLAVRARRALAVA